MITRKDIIDCFIYNSNINKPLFIENGFIVSDNNNSFSFSCPRNTGKTTFLIKFLIDDFLNTKSPKKYVYISNNIVNSHNINDKIIKYLKQLNIFDNVIDNRTKNYISLKNGCVVYFDTKVNRDMDVLVVDDAEYFFNGIETDYVFLHNLFLFANDKNKRLIMSISESDTLNMSDTNITEYMDIIERLKLSHYNLNSEKIKLYIRLNKIEKIRNRIILYSQSSL